MSFDYSKLSLDELLDVNENIDKEKYPKRYTQLRNELERRKQNSEFKRSERRIEKEKDIDFDLSEFIFQFSAESDNTARKLFILAFALVNIAFMIYLIPQYEVTELSDVHKYSTTVDSIVCREDKVVDEETDKIHRYYDLYIHSFQHTFSAIGISKDKCNGIAKDLQVGASVSIWHEQGLIHKLTSGDQDLLSYMYMQSKVRDVRTDGLGLYWIALVFLWLFTFKSLVNALAPGTFTTGD